ncbi:restriction endonuclease subunit S [Burkholderia vietnamiensis]|uniref:restriction endonuclease subunit S n=1 Tax=Burkholderia vietnamiensis TaxID=60552 RepID=UPI0009BFAFA0|nr:restriction endonuclease subunit S [Burkholderia vietnamiensis]
MVSFKMGRPRVTEELPLNWQITTLGTISSSPPLIAPESGKSFYYIDIGSIDRAKKEIVTARHLHGEDAPSRARKPVATGDTLVSMIRPNLNAVALVPSELDGSIASTGFEVLRPLTGIDARWIAYIVRTAAFVDAMCGVMQGALYPAVRAKDVRSFQIPLAPSAEQSRIADQLDDLFARLNSCYDRFDLIDSHVKNLREAILRSTVTDTFSGESPPKYKPRVVSIGEIASVGTGSTPSRANGRYFTSEGTPWITSAATAEPLIRSANEFITAEAISANRLRIYEPGTLLVAMYGEGKTRGQVSELGIAAAINQACAAVVVNNEIALTEYVKLALRANYFNMRELAEGGSQPNLNLSKIKNFEIPLPTLEQQAEIVKKAHSLLNTTDFIEAHLARARNQADRFSLLLLAKAFSGELISQDPSDEPASALLSRIESGETQSESKTLERKNRKLRNVRAPKITTKMTKSREDEDVKGQPYLAKLLRQLANPATIESLFALSNLPIADFYKQLAWEIANGLIVDNGSFMEARNET